MNSSMELLEALGEIPAFSTKVEGTEYGRTASLDTLQINVGRLCNLACKHCHLEAGPNRHEIMAPDVMEACIRLAEAAKVQTIDITGGAPEMNPHIEYLIGAARKVCGHVIVRTNLVILLEPQYRHMMEFYASHKVEVVCSLPYYAAAEMDRVRGSGAFDKAIQAIRELNGLGYGRDPELVLNMVYNPAGAYFPPPQAAMEREYRERLLREHGIVFNSLFTITNNPTGRFAAFLNRSGNLKPYMSKLHDAFNQGTLPGLMCRFQLSVGYDGQLYDCDFNQAAELPIESGETVFDLAQKGYSPRNIRLGKHCYGCTAGQGSSCGGATS